MTAAPDVYLDGKAAGGVDVKGGAVQQSNFDDYRVLQTCDVPDILMRIVARNAAPTGMARLAF